MCGTRGGPRVRSSAPRLCDPEAIAKGTVGFLEEWPTATRQRHAACCQQRACFALQEQDWSPTAAQERHVTSSSAPSRAPASATRRTTVSAEAMCAAIASRALHQSRQTDRQTVRQSDRPYGPCTRAGALRAFSMPTPCTRGAFRQTDRRTFLHLAHDAHSDRQTDRQMHIPTPCTRCTFRQTHIPTSCTRGTLKDMVLNCEHDLLWAVPA
jgi:hypothetical protein